MYGRGPGLFYERSTGLSLSCFYFGCGFLAWDSFWCFLLRRFADVRGAVRGWIFTVLYGTVRYSYTGPRIDNTSTEYRIV